MTTRFISKIIRGIGIDMKVVISYKDKFIRRDIVHKLREDYPNCEALGFGDCLLAAKSVYAGAEEGEPVNVLIAGTESLKLISMLKKAQNDINIVILADNEMHRDEAYALGAAAYVTRPFTREIISAAVEGRVMV